MTQYEQCMLAIMADPEDDKPRRAFAELIRASDPARSEFIISQLDRAARRRTGHEGASPSHREDRIRFENEDRWREDLGFYMGEIGRHRHVELDRGFPWICSMNPYLFLEQGQHILTNIAPLRGIIFFRDTEGDPFPVKELAASPLLERLDEIRFDNNALDDGDLDVIASSPHLARVMAWDIRNNPVSLATWEAFAANPHTRKCLHIRSDYEAPDRGPIGECGGRFDIWPNRYFEMSAQGRELERKYGYLPWLHDGNVCHWPDAHYWVAHKVLPRFVPGSPADAPTPYGRGLWPEPKREPRERFDRESLDAVW